MHHIEQLFRQFSSAKVGVVGDVMLDTYMWGGVERISPEAPVPIVSLHKKEQRIGGAGNVALNLQSLGAKAFVVSVTGDDEDARCLQQLFSGKKINTAYTFQSTSRITTNKTRIISRNQQMLRLDAEMTDDLSETDAEELLRNVRAFVETERPDMVILEDYNKGVLTEAVIREVIAVCKEAGIPTAVDPKRKNFFAYKEVDIFKPNLKEVKEAFNILPREVDEGFLSGVHEMLRQQLHHQTSFITLSEKGVFYQQSEKARLIPSHLRNIADVSGAGDTVIAVASLVYAVTKDVHLMAEVANIAGGLVCEEVGTAAISKKRLLHECQLLLHQS